MKEFEWGIVGSGIAGIVASEILTREGHSSVLIEKNDKLACETSRDFHEWIHTGSLYTLVPDNLLTLKYLLGAIDDLLEYYSVYENMNLKPTEKGLLIETHENGWFQNNNIHFKFRLKGRKFTFPWLFGVARAIYLIDRIKEHDWLRRRGGVTDPFKLKYKELLGLVKKLWKQKDTFYDYTTPDFTTDSRKLLRDLITTSIENGLYVSISNRVKSYNKQGEWIIIEGEKESFKVKNIVLCVGANISNFTNSRVKKSYAPMAIIKNVKPDTTSFVELDYFPKNCINIIKKQDSVGLIGGISFSKLEQCDGYINEVIEKHRAYDPGIEVLHKYVGIKSEIIFENQPRNYLYHILQMEEKVWSIIPGKFTLGFSIAPEFYRRVYKKNPRKIFKTFSNNGEYADLVSNTVWFDIINNGNK